MTSPTSSVSTIAYSLSDDLTKANNGATLHSVTDLITALLNLAGQHVSAFKRNTQVSYRLVSRARDLRDGINKLVDTIDGTIDNDFGAFETNTWDSYEAYISAIDPLEQLLFKFITLSSVEASLHLPDDTSIAACLTSVASWEEHRRDLREILGSLDAEMGLKDFPGLSPLSTDDIQKAKKHDDVTFVSMLCSSFSHSFLDSGKALRPPSQRLIKPVENQLTTLTTKLKMADFRDDLLEIAGKSCMVLNGVLKFVLQKSTKPMDVTTRNHLLKAEIWTEAGSLIKAIISATEKPSSGLGSTVDKYKAFVKLLQNIAGVVLPPRFYELPKQVGKVRRPYFARSYAFIGACRVLAIKFNENATKVHENVHSLEEAIEETMKALEAAAKAMTTIESFDTSVINTNDAGKAFADAESKIKECFADCGLDQLWANEKTKMDNAATKDAERIDQMNARIKASPLAPVNGSATFTPVQVNVVTCVHSGGNDGDQKCSHSTGKMRRTTSYNMDPATLLSALWWKQANDFSDERQHLTEGRAHFEQSKDARLSLDAAISSLKANAPGVYELNLVLE